MANALHNIICLEAEWEYRNAQSNKFSLNTEPLLNWLRTFHGCDIVYRHIINKQDLQYYLDYFASHKPKSVIRISLCRTAKRNPLIFPI